MKSQHILQKLPVRRDIAAHHIDMVNPLDRGTAPCILLRLIDEFRTQVWRSDILLHIVIDLHQVPIGIVQLVSPAMPDIPINPPFPITRCLKRLYTPIERLWAPGTQADVPQTRFFGLGDFECAMIIISPGSHIRRLPLAIRFFHPKDFSEEPEALVRFGCEDFKMSQLSNIMDRLLTVIHEITSSLRREMLDQQCFALSSS